jgi:hypothetical protein
MIILLKVRQYKLRTNAPIIMANQTRTKSRKHSLNIICALNLVFIANCCEGTLEYKYIAVLMHTAPILFAHHCLLRKY